MIFVILLTKKLRFGRKYASRINLRSIRPFAIAACVEQKIVSHISTTPKFEFSGKDCYAAVMDFVRDDVR